MELLEDSYMIKLRKTTLNEGFNNTLYTLSNLPQGKNISAEVLGKICDVISCLIGDIIDFF